MVENELRNLVSDLLSPEKNANAGDFTLNCSISTSYVLK